MGTRRVAFAKTLVLVWVMAILSGCHAEKAALGEEGGPPRHCIECYLGDDLP